MAVPSLPAHGSPDWYAWAQGVHNAAVGAVAKGDLLANVRDFGAIGNGTADDTAAIQAAVDAAATASGEVLFPRGTYKVTAPITLTSGAALRGVGAGRSALTATHAGAVFSTSTPGVRSFVWTITGLGLTGPGSATAGSVGLDLDSVSTSKLTDVTVSGFEKGIRVRSTINGGSVYNRFVNVTAQSCATGFSIEALGSNSGTFTNCRANACTTYGVRIVDSNANVWLGGQIESCAIGLSVAASSNALADYNQVALTRFENNTTKAWEVTSTNVRYFQMVHPQTVGTYTFTDSGKDTQLTGSADDKVTVLRSARSDVAGSWLYERTTNGGSENPAMVVRDTVTSFGTPVTHQSETERDSGYFYRGKRGGQTYWDVNSLDGSMRMPLGGHVELTERASDAPAPAANSARLYLKDNGSGKTQLCVRFATGAVQIIATEP